MATVDHFGLGVNESDIFSNARWPLSIEKLRGHNSLVLIALSITLPPLLIILLKIVFPTYDPREPPILRPKFPFFGHVVSLMREGTSWHRRLYNEFLMPICTLPMFHGKMYMINSPDLIASAMKNQQISFDPFLLEFSQGMLGLNENTMRVISNKATMDELLFTIHNTLMGEPLYKMNVVALSKLMEGLNGHAKIEIPDIYIWIWDMMGTATMAALFGPKSPILPEHMHLFSEFEDGVALLSLGFAQNILAPGPLRARNKISDLIKTFYEAGHELGDDVSTLLQRRSVILRREGMNNEEISRLETTFPWVGTTNTIPTLYWFFVHIFSSPDLVEKVSCEMEAITTITSTETGRMATISAKDVDKKCPFYLACYREVLRMYIHNVGNRRVMKDTTLKGGDGREYLLKEGTNVQWSTSLTHLMESVWGDDGWTYKPERFYQVPAQDERRRRGANLPFGGGKHLCPGRNFALAENLGFIGVIALGFEARGVHVPKSEDPILGLGARKPVWGSQSRGASIERRTGWEDITWRFVE